MFKNSFITNIKRTLLFLLVSSFVVAGFLFINFSYVKASEISISGFEKIYQNFNGFNDTTGAYSNPFGNAVAYVGDINLDGVEDLVVGASEMDEGAADAGAIWILFMNGDGSVQGHQKISAFEGNLDFQLQASDSFSRGGIVGLGDLDGDGVNDIAVASMIPNGLRGSVWVLFMNTDGTVRESTILASGQNGFPVIDSNDQFGYSLSIADIDHDGNIELLVGARNDDDGFVGGNVTSENKGALWIVELNTDGTAGSVYKISDNTFGFNGLLSGREQFGVSVTSLADIDGDGVEDLAVGSENAADGAVWLLRMNSDYTVKNANRIAEGESGLVGVVESRDKFGASVAYMGDIDENGTFELAVGAPQHGIPNSILGSGAVWILSLDHLGQVVNVIEIDDTDLDSGENFGYFGGLGNSSSFSTNNAYNLVVSSPHTIVGEPETTGIVWLLDLEALANNQSPTFTLINQTVAEGTLLSFHATATDPDNDTLTYVADNLPTGATYDSVTGQLAWTPDYDDAGEYEVTFVATDDGDPALSASTAITITVENVNRAPVLNPIGNQLVNEGQTLQFSVSATDPDGDNVTYTATNLPAGSAFDPNTQVFSWTPQYNDAGNYDNIEFAVIDDGNPMELDVELITITVGDVNRPPLVDNPGPQEVLETETVTFDVTATDPDNDSVDNRH